jgi:hypothetical protein
MDLRARLTLLVLGTTTAGLTVFACNSDSTSNGPPTLDASPDVTVDDGSPDAAGPGPDASDAGSAPDVVDATVADVVDSGAPVEAAADAPAEASPDAATACDDAGAQSHVLLTFDPNDPEYVSGVSWIDSTGATTGNWSAAGGPLHCTDPQESFGQAYGAPENTTPYPVVAGHLATLSAVCNGVTITSAAADCTDAGQLPVTTSYTFYGGAKQNEVEITRSFAFPSGEVDTGVGVRPFVPRVSLSVFDTTIFPNRDGTGVSKVPVGNCPGDCFTPVGPIWNGQWFADVAASGYAIIVLRDVVSLGPVDLTINYDSYSSSNLSSFVVLQPDGGWTGPVNETEYMCFEDLTTWPQSQRDAAVLPAGCGP